jgi:hypothetical protein
MILVHFCDMGKIDMDHKEIGCKITDWIQLTKDQYQQ